MPCPFLTRLSNSYVRNYGSSLAKLHGQHCPVMSRMIGTTVPTDNTANRTVESEAIARDAGVEKCPFLAEQRNAGDIIKEASKELQEDMIDLTPKASKSMLLTGNLQFRDGMIFQSPMGPMV